MSKAAPVVQPVVNHVTTNPVYTIGEKVYYTVNGVQCPFVIAAVQESSNNGNVGGDVFVIAPDITDKSSPWPAGQGVVGHKNVLLSALSDRTV